MNPARITLLASHDTTLREYLQGHAEGHERAAIILFKCIRVDVPGLTPSDRYISVHVHPFEEGWITSSSTSHIAFETEPLRELFRRCEEESLVFGFAHNHPGGFPDFSDVDETNELTLLQAISNRNGRDVSFVALLWTQDAWKGRVRTGQFPAKAVATRHVLIPDHPLRIYKQLEPPHDEAFARQTAAFGAPFVATLQSLRVAVVGLGGTGSPTATLLARSGIGELILVDPDLLEVSNLNRVRGAARSDAGTSKATVLHRFISALGLPVKVSGLSSYIDSIEGIDALASSDLVFGCTDDQIGRELLTISAYAYAVPYIDVGLGGQIAQGKNGQPYLRYHHGRVSTLLPEAGECLFCQGVLTEQAIRREYALRDDPHMDDARARERYLLGGTELAPGVGPFTSAVADFGVATLFDLVAPYRKFPDELRWDSYSIDFVKMSMQSAQSRNDECCPYCSERQFLVMRETQRLNRPALGARSVAL